MSDQADAGGAPGVDGERTEDAVPQADPDEIQREIEATRAELAASIDAIADRVSPRRAASRGASRVKAVVGSVRGNHQADELPSAPSDLEAQRLALTAGPGAQSPPRRLRTGRVAIAGGVVVVAAVAVVYLVRRRG